MAEYLSTYQMQEIPNAYLLHKIEPLRSGQQDAIQEMLSRQREVVGSNAFNLEYDSAPTEEELRDDIVSYIGEYRLRVQEFDYELHFSRDLEGSGKLQLRDKHRGESMRTKAQRAIVERSLRGDPVHREIAEDQGLKSLEVQLHHSEGPLFWFSPPGPKSEGYGDYGFLFKGKVFEQDDQGMKLAMKAIRLDNATLDQYNAAFSDLTGRAITYSNADDFLSSPVVLQDTISDLEVDQVLQRHFSFQLNEDEKQSVAWIMEKLNPSIDDFIHFIKQGSKKEKLTAFHAIENYALQLKKEYQEIKNTKSTTVFVDPRYAERRLADIVGQHGHEPPKVAGSCGSTGSDTLTSSNPLTDSYKALRKALGLAEEEWFVCPKCGFEADGPIGNKCPGVNCGLTKEAYAKAGGKVC